MCGILALLQFNLLTGNENLELLLELIDRRGPDYSSPLIEHPTICGHWLKLKSSVLHLRGDTLQEQPIIDERGNVLLFNGQIYDFSGWPIDQHQSDTIFLSKELSRCKSHYEIAEKFAEIDGPFAIIYWHHKFRKLFYGRDVFGRKSLCVLKSESSQPVIISSVANDNLERSDLKWHEVQCDGIYCVDFNSRDQLVEMVYPWDLNSIYPKTARCAKVPGAILAGDKLRLSLLRPLNYDLTDPKEFDEQARAPFIEMLGEKFIDSVKKRFNYTRSDCLLCRKSPRYSPSTGRVICRDSKVAVAFSGGIDSTLIALALDRVLDAKERIDLVTVSFRDDSPDRDAVASAFREIRQLKPSRRWRLVVCDVSKIELQRERDRQIRRLILPCDTVFDDSIGCASWFVGRAEGRAIDSEFGDSWFTTHFGQFLRYDPSNSYSEDGIISNYKSSASMIFVGASIDEQLGGYSSHRKAWSERGTLGICEEVSFLMRRISNRNLGRDDRVYSDHGRDLKLPFLDSQFVSYINEMPMAIKMNLSEALDIGPKKILRELALSWGLKETGRRVKRAMQFGTKIANLEGHKERANDVCPRLKRNIGDAVVVDLSD